jgi:hypothetical protein
MGLDDDELDDRRQLRRRQSDGLLLWRIGQLEGAVAAQGNMLATILARVNAIPLEYVSRVDLEAHAGSRRQLWLNVPLVLIAGTSLAVNVVQALITH